MLDAILTSLITSLILLVSLLAYYITPFMGLVYAAVPSAVASYGVAQAMNKYSDSNIRIKELEEREKKLEEEKKEIEKKLEEVKDNLDEINVQGGGDLDENHKMIIGGSSRLSNLQKDVIEDYRKYKLPKIRASFQEFCFPKKWQIQPQQEFVAEYMRPGVGKKDKVILVDHLIGAGKTCLIIKTASKYIKYGKPLILMPASLIPGFYDELDGFCGEKSQENGKKSHLKRDDFNVMSYNKFLTTKKVEAPIILIDEVQNVANESGEFYKKIHQFINSRTIPVVLVTGTPIFDNPTDLVALGKLMRINNLDAETLTVEIVKKAFSGKVSFFAGAPSYTFPKTNINIVMCKMSKFQTRWYKSQIEAEKNTKGNIVLSKVNNNFYIKSRQRANIVYPKGLNDSTLTNHVMDNLSTYSTKFAKIIKKLKRGELSFVYVDFTGPHGINALIRCLEHEGYCNYLKKGAGKKRYVIWSGDQTQKEKGEIRTIFNNEKNDDASQIQIVIGSPAIKEGVSLLRIREVHIMSPYWNWSRLQQIYGRAARFCSHKSLPARHREVDIFIYIAVVYGFIIPKSLKDSNSKPVSEKKIPKNIKPEESIDLYMLNIANIKKKENDPYIEALMESAIDRGLFQI